MAQRIDLADDEAEIRSLMTEFLTQEGFLVSAFPDGDQLLSAVLESPPDLVILDILMPGTDGMSVCSLLRKKLPQLPIILISVKDSPLDRVAGLTLGSDDYLSKPFLPLELVARVRALLRRTAAPAPAQIDADTVRYGPLTLYPERREALLKGEPFQLTPSEYDFLLYLMQHSSSAVSREELLKTIWNMNWSTDTRATDDLVKRLRRKLRERRSSVRIETVWGYGFRISLEEPSAEE
ncbi:MAG: response regulator transcription factor [Oscillospiraceae bacterium]|nr:response regulator transcription factor [Oscillospiraceae bacterium]